MRKPLLFSQNGYLHICGHRGHNTAAPENTLAAFRMAHELGGTSLEIDTVLTSDDEIVVLHDRLVDRTTNGTGAARDMTAAEIAALDAGSRFGTAFAGERVPTLRETLALARERDLILEVEVKEKVRLAAYDEALRRFCAKEAEALDRLVMISFDHAHLKSLKAKIPGIRTAGIVHEHFPDPVAVARMADLDELCIDLDVFDPAQARDIHAAGIAIRCHAYSPKTFAKGLRAGLGWQDDLASWLAEGLIDTLSGDDVAWIAKFADDAGVPRKPS
jgi:glycerophosphoryl diester phosphodiesterase